MATKSINLRHNGTTQTQFPNLKLPHVYSLAMAALLESFKTNVHEILYDQDSVLVPYLTLLESKTGLNRTKLAYGKLFAFGLEHLSCWLFSGNWELKPNQN